MKQAEHWAKTLMRRTDTSTWSSNSECTSNRIRHPIAATRYWQKRIEMTRSQTPAKPALSNRNIEICQWVMPGNDVLISSVESGLAEASRPR